MSSGSACRPRPNFRKQRDELLSLLLLDGGREKGSVNDVNSLIDELAASAQRFKLQQLGRGPWVVRHCCD